MDIDCGTYMNEIMYARVYGYKSLSLYNRCLETVPINNKNIFHFVNLRSK